MGGKNEPENGMSRNIFFKMASAAGFGTMPGTFLFNISGYDFPDSRTQANYNLGVLYRMKKLKTGEDWPFSISEVLMEPGSETYVMINREMVATYEGISGQAIFLSAKDKLETQVPRVSRTLQRMVKPGKHYQIFNPSNQRTRLIQRYEPFWQPDKSFIKIGPKIIPGRDLWFERHEVLNRLNSGLKYKFIEQMPGIIELKLRIEPGLKSICEYYRYSTHYFKVTQGAGIMTIDGKKHILKMADEINIPPGSKFQFQNPFPDRWEMTLFLKPGWIPEESFYEREGKLIPGTDVWFEIKID